MTDTDAHRDLRSAVKDFEKPVVAKSIWQFLTTVALFAGACALMYWSLQLSYWLTLLLSIPTGALLVRIFIIQHDCGHGSFFSSQWANNLVGRICSVLTLTPYSNWRRQHAGHHAIWNNLDKRYSGADIYSTCLTVAEYRALTPRGRLFYRVPRHPLVAHVLIPPLVFLFLYRIPFDTPKTWLRERLAVHGTNLALAAIVTALIFAAGVMPVLMVQLPVTIVTSIIGVWLFAVQHRFDDSRWARQLQWSFAGASLEGSSYLRLPRILQWFTGNIGFHNVHHFAPRVPNYRLEQCYRSTPQLHEKEPLTMFGAMKSIGLALWDEDSQRLVRFRDVRAGAKSAPVSVPPLGQSQPVLE